MGLEALHLIHDDDGGRDKETDLEALVQVGREHLVLEVARAARREDDDHALAAHRLRAVTFSTTTKLPYSHTVY